MLRHKQKTHLLEIHAVFRRKIGGGRHRRLSPKHSQKHLVETQRDSVLRASIGMEYLLHCMVSEAQLFHCGRFFTPARQPPASFLHAGGLICSHLSRPGLRWSSQLQEKEASSTACCDKGGAVCVQAPATEAAAPASRVQQRKHQQSAPLFL